jgi:NAD-dependent SIR2 family protein deacetylase
MITGYLISQIFDVDVSSSPDLLLIIGTSLEIRAIRSFVSRLVNKNVPSILMDYQLVDFSGSHKLSYHLKGPCDLFTTFLMDNITDVEIRRSL